MIITKLQGGLGNQMFQYAAGWALAARTGQPLKVDVSFLNADPAGRYTARKLELDQFDLDLQIADENEVRAARQSGFLRRTLGKSNILTDAENDFLKFRAVAGPVYLDGYWQSEKYFSDRRADILERFRIAPDRLPGDEWEHVAGSETVAVHVRRGDYVTLAAARSFHGVLDTDYYFKAMAIYREKLRRPRFVVFSDDIGWCRETFSKQDIHDYIGDTGKGSAFDLLLMAGCAHQVIANSSFSWWAAWLNRNAHKMVVAPRRWFKVHDARESSICPAAWLRI